MGNIPTSEAKVPVVQLEDDPLIPTSEAKVPVVQLEDEDDPLILLRKVKLPSMVVRRSYTNSGYEHTDIFDMMSIVSIVQEPEHIVENEAKEKPSDPLILVEKQHNDINDMIEIGDRFPNDIIVIAFNYPVTMSFLLLPPRELVWDRTCMGNDILLEKIRKHNKELVEKMRKVINEDIILPDIANIIREMAFSYILFDPLTKKSIRVPSVIGEDGNEKYSHESEIIKCNYRLSINKNEFEKTMRQIYGGG